MKNVLFVTSENVSPQSGGIARVTYLLADGLSKKGIRCISGADIGISTTGMAGPTGSDVGLVYIGISTEKNTFAKELHLSEGLPDEREKIRFLSSSYALYYALKEIEN